MELIDDLKSLLEGSRSWSLKNSFSIESRDSKYSHTLIMQIKVLLAYLLYMSHFERTNLQTKLIDSLSRVYKPNVIHDSL